MTSLTINTQTTSLNAILSIPTASTFGKKANTSKSFTSFTATSKNWYQKPSPRFTSMDWDLNMNELEFE